MELINSTYLSRIQVIINKGQRGNSSHPTDSFRYLFENFQAIPIFSLFFHFIQCLKHILIVCTNSVIYFIRCLISQRLMCTTIIVKRKITTRALNNITINLVVFYMKLLILDTPPKPFCKDIIKIPSTAIHTNFYQCLNFRLYGNSTT